MHARPLIGYTGVTVVLVAALARIGRFGEPGGDAPAAFLPFLALGLSGWALGRFLRQDGLGTLARSLVLLGDALAGPCAWWAALLLGAGGRPDALVAAGLGAAVFVAVSAFRILRDRAPDPLHPYFVAAWGGLLAVLARATVGLSLESTLVAVAAVAIAVAAAERALAGAARPHAAVAAALLLLAGVSGTAAGLVTAPSATLVASFHVVALALAVWTVLRSEALGPLARWLGGATYGAFTVALTATLAFLHAPLSVYVGATAGWITALALLAVRLRTPRADAFRDSAAWTAALLSCALVAAAAPAWWPAVGQLPRIPWSDAWRAGSWTTPGVRDVTAAGLAAVAGATGMLAFFRRRHPSIAYSVAGLVGNTALRAALAYGAPLVALLAAGTNAGAWAPVAALAVAAGLLLTSRMDALGQGPACAGYAAVAAAAAAAPAGGGAAVTLVAGAMILFGRAARSTALTPVVTALAALTAAVVVMALGPGPAATPVGLVALLALAVARILLAREAESARTGAVLAWGTAAGIAAIALALLSSSSPLAGMLALWLGTPLLFAGRRPDGARASYDPRLFVGEALETAVLLVAHCAGAAALVLLWRATGSAPGDAGPVLAGWAWAHLWLYRRLARRRPGRPVTTATAIGSQTLALASLGLPLASSSLRIAIATLLMNAALFFFWSDHPGTRGRRRLLLVAGHALNLAAIATALLEPSAWAPLALVAAALVYLWRARRTDSAATHLAFLVTVTAASVLAVRMGDRGPALWVPSLTAVGLLAVGGLSQATSGRTTAVRLSWGWAVMIGLVTIVGAVVLRFPAWRGFAILWVGFLASVLVWDSHRGSGTVRPGEPEDEWLSLASHGVGHLAGGAALVAVCVVWGFGLGVAAASLGAWAWLHWGLALAADRHGTGRRALGAAARGAAAAALVLAAVAWRETGPATLACALGGAFALLVGMTADDPWWRLVSALCLTEAIWIQGLAAGVTLPEYYLTTAAACLYLVLRLRRPRPAEPGAFLHARAALRSLRAALLPLAIFGLAVGYPFAALLGGGGAVHLVCLAAGTGLVLLGFWRAGESRLFEPALCALLLAGALHAFAAGILDRTSAGLLLAAGVLVLANLLADGRLLRGARSGRPRSDALPRGA